MPKSKINNNKKYNKSEATGIRIKDENFNLILNDVAFETSGY